MQPEVKMDMEDCSGSRKRRHEGSASAPQKTSLELLKLVETPSFEELSRRYPEFLEAWTHVQHSQHQARNTKMVFSSCVTQEFSLALTRGLLHWYFQLRLPHLPSHHLCPPIPNRFFHLHWIQSYLLPSLRQGRIAYPSAFPQTHCGLDLGVGASCIYPLLAVQAFQCNMAGTEVDPEALKIARENVEANQLQHKIHLVEVIPSHSQVPSSPPGGPLTRAMQAWNPQHSLDFVMTNPPFYDPNDEAAKNPRTGDGRARAGMTASEGIYPGGEVGFVLDMIADSLRGDNAARMSSLWYSCMLGKKSSLVKLQKILIHVLGPAHVEATEYGPGQYTRWFLAWTLGKPATTALSASVEQTVSPFTVFIQEDNMEESSEAFASASGVSALSEVANRMISFFDSSPGGWHLVTTATSSGSFVTLKTRERVPLVISSFVDESEPNATLPHVILEALKGRDNSQFLPDEGHFVILATLRPSNQNVNAVTVQLACYRHSTRGLRAIEKIRNGMEAEICRTNRKWRRLFQRQVQQAMQIN
jgi:23S rRNA A1618 N6-methylase RlmF